MRRGFTLLEMMAATLVMGIAVVGLLSGISTSMRHAARLMDYDRAVLLARSKMDDLLIDRGAPLGSDFSGNFDPELMGGVQGGWRARVTPFEAPPGAGPGEYVLQRVELEVWWMAGDQRRSFFLSGYRQATRKAGEAP
jgi:general secretion pathway protein I